jgi:hypothetical protein
MIQNTNSSRARRLISFVRQLYNSIFSSRKPTIVDLKNSKLNANIRAFMLRTVGQKLPDRETQIIPEVLIPCYNQGRYLFQALESIKKNGFSGAVTIINDASTDDTERNIYELAKNYQFHLITNKINLNQAGSLNKAIEQSACNFFIILNADDYLLPYCIDTVLVLASKHDKIRLFGGGNLPFCSDEMIKLASNFARHLNYEPQLQVYTSNDVKYVNHPNDINMTMSSCSFFRTAWKHVGGFYPFAERVCSFDDRDFQLRVASLFEIGVLEEPLALWRMNSSTGKGQQ